MQRPSKSEYNPYFQGYLDLVPPGHFLDLFDQHLVDVAHFLAQIPTEKHHYAYAEGKWTVADLIQHLVDMERVFLYRATVAARADKKTVLPFVDEDHYAQCAHANLRSFSSLVAEFKALKASSKYFFESLSPSSMSQSAQTEGGPVTARAIAYISIGHWLHHKHVLVERYGLTCLE